MTNHAEDFSLAAALRATEGWDALDDADTPDDLDAVLDDGPDDGFTSGYADAPARGGRSTELTTELTTGDLDLALCGACGFVTNLAFDPASQELSAQYEASQGFSATFNRFARSLAKGWAERYRLAGKTAVEIGCGKGEFLATLCREAGCRGVGYDPTLDPRRLPDTAGLDIEWVPGKFDARAAGRPMDFVCCRHTLEHIPDAGAFLRTVRDAIGPRPAVRVGFEVTVRIDAWVSRPPRSGDWSWTRTKLSPRIGWPPGFAGFWPWRLPAVSTMP